MKKKDIFVVAICTVIIIGSIFFILNGFTAKSPQKPVQNKATIEFSGNIDKGSIEKMKTRKDYGTPNMDNIGRENPFASF